jgi:hypothetical protein
MQWQWIRNGKIYRSVRAVDTATHPDYQGKGIFKKLTQQQVADCKDQGIHFVYNTPNSSSKPGYLKMGWVEQGKMPLKIKLLRPLAMIRSKWSAFDYNDALQDTSGFQKWSNEIMLMVNHHTWNNPCLSTVHSAQFVSWRYANNPLFRYYFFTDNVNFLLVVRIKAHSSGLELRMVDYLQFNDKVSSAYINNYLKKQVSAFCKQRGIHFISFSGRQYQQYKDCFNWMGYLPVRRMGPLITLRDLNMHQHFPQLLKTENWCYSLGDMELF